MTVGRLDDNDQGRRRPSANKEIRRSKSRSCRRRWGSNLSSLSDDLRKKFKIRDDIKGVLVTGVDPSVATADPDKRLAPGDVIVEVQYQSVGTPADMQKRIDQMKSQGKKMAVLLVSNGDGETRFVALSLQ